MLGPSRNYNRGDAAGFGIYVCNFNINKAIEGYNPGDNVNGIAPNINNF